MNKFLQAKLNRALEWNGKLYYFNKIVLDEYNQPQVSEERIEVKGIYHETNSYVTKSSSDATVTVSEKSPSLLVSWKDACKLELEDTLEIEGVSYRVSGLTNIQNYNVFGSISLEVIQ